MIDLSILVCSITERFDTFLPKIHSQLDKQYQALTPAEQERVELLILTDNRRMVLGSKRNAMIELAQGNYIAFVDDDDRIADDYLKSLLDATEKGADSIVFTASVSLNGAPAKPCYYSKDNERDFNRPEAYYRIPNHICCIKRSIALQSKFPAQVFGEDAVYAKQLLPLLQTEYVMDRTLYYYDYNVKTTATRPQAMPAAKPKPQPKLDTSKPIVDVVVLSRADTAHEWDMTQRAINTCIEGAGNLPINVIVVENTVNKVADYKNATTLRRTGAFNYNAFANYGAEQGTADWVMIANNDLVFDEDWLKPLLDAQNDVVSPREPNDPRQYGLKGNEMGDAVGRHFSGWCFMIKRSLWERIGKFDTDVTFWCSDDAVIEQVLAEGVTPMLVYNSIVHHFTSKTLNSIPIRAHADMKWRNVYIFNKKYNKQKFINDPRYIEWLKKNAS